MNINKEKRNQIMRILLFVFVLGFVYLLIRRLHYTISHYDEVFNIYVSYLTVGMGKRHLVENPMMMSMGNLANLPFLSLYYHITGGTEGVVLFIRYMYLVMNLILSTVFYILFKRALGKKACLLFSLVWISYAPFSIYSIWYDSAALFFLLMGALLISGADLSDQKGKGVVFKYLAGICHACMVYAYPTMAAVIIVLTVYKTVCLIRKKATMKQFLIYWLPYLLGGMTIAGIFAIYVLNVGWENIFLFRHKSVDDALSGRTLDKISAAGKEAEKASALAPLILQLKSILGQIGSILLSAWNQQKLALAASIPLLVQWIIGKKKKGTIRILLLFEIVIVAGICHTGTGQWATQTMYAYYFLWTPFLYAYLEKEEKEKWGAVIVLLTIIAVTAMGAVGFTAYYGVKASMGLYSGAVSTFLLMILVAKQEKTAEIPMHLMLILVLAACNLAMLYSNVYEDEKVSECSHLMEKGIYKGIYGEEKDIIYEEFPALLGSLELGDDATLYTNEYIYMAAYMEGKLLFNGGDPYEIEERLDRGESLEEIYSAYAWTDVIIMDEAKYAECQRVVNEFFPVYYDLVHEENNFHMYVKKESRA